jgi:hypothetical protein
MNRGTPTLNRRCVLVDLKKVDKIVEAFRFK